MKTFQTNLKAELAGLAFLQPNFTLTTISGGALNSSYRLDSGNQRYFLKTFESDSITSLDRKALFLLQNELVTQQLAVRPVYLSDKCGFQIDAWLEGKTLVQKNLESPIALKLLAQVLVKIHNARVVNAKPLNLPEQWLYYIDVLSTKRKFKNLDLLQRYTDYWLDACSDKLTFCHNDLALSHVTFGESVKVFDWEYSALSSPYFDLASCLAINQFGENETSLLCKYYCGITGYCFADVYTKVKAMKPLVEFTNELWFAAAKLVV